MNSFRNIRNWIVGIGIVACICGFSTAYGASAAKKSAAKSKIKPTLEVKQEADYSDAGADTCLKCHDDASEYPAVAIFRSSHAVIGDKRTPFGQLQCESCHGPAGEHSKDGLKKAPKEKR